VLRIGGWKTTIFSEGSSVITIEIEPVAVNSVDRYFTFRALTDRLREVSLEALACLLNGALDDEVTAALGRGHRSSRASSGTREMPWSCGRCETSLARDFARDGHYPRQLQTMRGSVECVRVPMLECKVCGGSAAVEFAALAKHQQLWLDVDEEALFAYGTEEGLRHIADRVGRALGWPVSASSIQRRVHRLQSLLDAWRAESISDPPDALMVDGLWFTTVLPTQERFTDGLGRKRPKTRKVKRVAIVVLGLWAKTGRQEILDFEIADSEDEATVVELLNRVHERGVTEAHLKLIGSDGSDGIIAAIETAYPTVARQRCIFHKLDNVCGYVRDRANRPALMREAAAIYKADDLDQAHVRRDAWVAKWLATETEAVACLVTDFEATVGFLRPGDLNNPRRFRTINPIEGGVMRTLRKKVDHATAFHSNTGAEVAIFLCAKRLNANQHRRPWSQEAKSIIQT